MTWECVLLRHVSRLVVAPQTNNTDSEIIIQDIWEVRERGKAMGIFYLGPLCGPLLAPIIGGVLAEKLGWRSTQWFLAIYGGAVLSFLFFALPEVSLLNPP